MHEKQVAKLVSSRAFGRPDADARPGDIVGYLLKSLSHAVRHAFDDSFRRHSLEVSFAHIPVLYVAKNEPGTPGAQLARRLSITAQSMNVILKRLERQGYIERRPHPSNRRAECWFVTAAGSRELDLARSAGRIVIDRMLQNLSRAEVAQLGSLLQRCLEGLEQPHEPPPVRAPVRRSAAGARRGRK